MDGITESIAAQGVEWADADPAKCVCRGSGWWLSDWDVWVKCVVGAHKGPHPEDAGYGDQEDDWDHEEEDYQLTMANMDDNELCCWWLDFTGQA